MPFPSKEFTASSISLLLKAMSTLSMVPCACSCKGKENDIRAGRSPHIVLGALRGAAAALEGGLIVCCAEQANVLHLTQGEGRRGGLSKRAF